MLHDENVYPDPMTFKPERFLDENGNIDLSVQNPSVASFGFGRRSVELRAVVSHIPETWMFYTFFT